MVTKQSVSTRLPILILFLFSGAAGLIYQVAWTRLLTLIFGSTVFAVSAVLTAFMGGLGLGSYIFGRLADRDIRILRLYGILEFAIGFYALLFGPLRHFIEVAIVAISQNWGLGFTPLTAFKFVFAVLLLLIPTVCMGATLPLLSRFLIRSMRLASREVAYLYSLNTTGAMLGTVLTGFFLIPLFGLKITLLIAVALNILVGSTALLMGQREKPHKDSKPAAAKVTHVEIKETPHSTKQSKPAYAIPQIRMAFIIMFFSGLFAMGYEVVWTRVLVLYMGSTNFTFTTMLATFLFGIAFGSLILGAFAPRIKNPLLLLALAEIIIGASIFLTIPALWKASQIMEGQSFRALTWTNYNLGKFCLCFLVMLLPTLLMGATFPLAVQVVIRSLSRIGQSVGKVYSINTVGAILGSAITGLLLLPTIGPAPTFVILAAGNIILGGCAVLFAGLPRIRWWAVAAAVPLVVLVMTQSSLSAMMRRTVVERISESGMISAEGDDLEAHVAVSENTYGKRLLWINGDVVARSTGGATGHNLLGHLPMLLARNNEEVLVIALGTGITAGSTSLYDPAVLDIVEISPLVLEYVSLFSEDNYSIHENPTVRFVVDDGRNYVQVTNNKYDVIGAEPLHPWKSGVANLYTKEYYKACQKILNPGGMVVQWIPLYGPSMDDIVDLTKTFHDVFPETSIWLFGGDFVLLGHSETFSIDIPELEARMSPAPITKDLKKVNVENPLDLLNHLLMGPKEVASFVEKGRVMSDWFPFIEYDGPRHVHQNTPRHRPPTSLNTILQALPDYRCSTADYIGKWPEEGQDSVSVLFEKQTQAWRLTLEGLVAQNLGMLEESSQKLGAALELAPWLGETSHYLSRTYAMIARNIYQQGGNQNINRANDIWKLALDLAPESPSLLYSVATCQEQLGKNEESILYWERLLSIMPPHASRVELAHSRLQRLRGILGK
ncbi:MAG: fused MFS/spermidine synthase [Candidatus Eisenbacteria bacterium]|uniref:Fused MFS/spermidine synthase n=1 Tax=Eiseniibacteriota bacterium TaxID=2212470 RepID=A0A948RW40_UNCEI|nr:fused MFS/spermidine synthase [Candidatus Eisenbacteria bacterium]MBU1948869.1 fused MFS/spermidine synthase [Candidatus Eisenbacteria bacterium]MBU2691566.1 fused MFS/spermidine synthase [Candidatus Eisenbacteria bacterium]